MRHLLFFFLILWPAVSVVPLRAQDHADVEVAMSFSWTDVPTPFTGTANYQTKVICPACKGARTIKCSKCNGTGIAGYFYVHGVRAAHGCTNCGGVYGSESWTGGGASPGTGRVKCPTCRGTGRVNSANKEPASMPAQVQVDGARQKTLEEEQAKAAEKARLESIDWEAKKQKTLKRMKGISEGELGLKGLKDAGSELKGVGSTNNRTAPKASDCTWGDLDASVVDLRCLGLDPDKPIRIDRAVVRGRRRVIPAQIDPATFENAHYNKGFWYLMQSRYDMPSAVADAVNAIDEFERALKERPDDPLVYNGLDLAVAIHKGRVEWRESVKARAAEYIRLTYAALMQDEVGSARAFITRARDLNPNSTTACFLSSALEVFAPEKGKARTLEQRVAYRIVGSSLVSMATENFNASVAMLEVARDMVPNDPVISKLFEIVKRFDAQHLTQ